MAKIMKVIPIQRCREQVSKSASTHKTTQLSYISIPPEMGSGERSVHGKKQELKDVPKGCLAIKVGQGEDQQRFVVPVIYFNHPLFKQLLKESEEEYGFDQKGPITIPCHVEQFRNIRGLIDREKSLHNNHNHAVRCFGF